jgi:hypothetical protein
MIYGFIKWKRWLLGTPRYQNTGRRIQPQGLPSIDLKRNALTNSPTGTVHLGRRERGAVAVFLLLPLVEGGNRAVISHNPRPNFAGLSFGIEELGLFHKSVTAYLGDTRIRSTTSATRRTARHPAAANVIPD